MLKIDNLKEALDDFSDKIVADAKSNLVSSGKVDTGKLKDTLTNLGAKVSKNSIEIGIKMMPYGAFIDKGVRGVGGVRKTTSAFKKILANSHETLHIYDWDTWSVEGKDAKVAIITSWEIF
jgi:hypothetical protein